MPLGRPTDYSEELCATIFRRIALGENLNIICADEAMPSQDTVYRWRHEKPGFSEKYQIARQQRADARSDRIDDLARKVAAGKIDAPAASVILKAEIWQAGRENPKDYGDKQSVEHSGSVSLASLVEQSTKPTE